MSTITDLDFEELLLEDYVDIYNYEERFENVWKNCILLSIYSIIPTISKLVVVNFILAYISSTGIVSELKFNLCSAITGIYLLNTLENTSGKLILVACFVGSYILLNISYYVKKYFNIRNIYFIAIISISLLIFGYVSVYLLLYRVFYFEYYLFKPEIWLQVRGVIMILVMKLISLGDDVEKCDKLPSIIEYFGYTLSGSNVMFGPWIPFSDYINLYRKPKKKNIWWLIGILQIFFTAILFLVLSNCLANYFISEESNRLLIAYKEAFSFRTSHYFICYLAEIGMVTAGYKSTNNSWRFIITNPLEIEFPSALAVVVSNWNRPMHDFLKKYVFRSLLNYGKFIAVFATFLISSFLHGFELRVSVVLITIGIFSYLQVIRRDMISRIFNCCVRVRSCKSCNHKYKRDSIFARFILIIYSIFTVLHLAYLGVLMDPTTEEIGIYEKWKYLYFYGHVIMFINAICIF